MADREAGMGAAGLGQAPVSHGTNARCSVKQHFRREERGGISNERGGGAPKLGACLKDLGTFDY